MRIWLTDGGFVERHDGSVSPVSDFIVLSSGEEETFFVFSISLCGQLHSEIESLPTNRFVSSFKGIEFYDDEGSRFPYRSYYYPIVRCEETASTDGERYLHQSPAGVWEHLFVESLDRPFYLERDTQNSHAARIVITFVPSPHSKSASTVD